MWPDSRLVWAIVCKTIGIGSIPIPASFSIKYILTFYKNNYFLLKQFKFKRYIFSKLEKIKLSI
jgi:hypothetical protein